MRDERTPKDVCREATFFWTQKDLRTWLLETFIFPRPLITFLLLFSQLGTWSSILNQVIVSHLRRKKPRRLSAPNCSQYFVSWSFQATQHGTAIANFQRNKNKTNNSKRKKFLTFRSGGVGHGPKGIMGKKSKTAHLHLTFALFTSLVTP